MQSHRHGLLHRVGTSFGALRVLCASRAADANRAHNLSVHYQRNSSFHGHCTLDAQDPPPFTAGRQRVLQGFCRPLKQRGRAGFINRHVGAAELRVIHFLVIDKVSPLIDDRHRDSPIIFRRLRERRCGRLLRILQANGLTIGVRHLRHCSAKGAKYDEQDDQHLHNTLPRHTRSSFDSIRLLFKSHHIRASRNSPAIAALRSGVRVLPINRARRQRHAERRKNRLSHYEFLRSRALKAFAPEAHVSPAPNSRATLFALATGLPLIAARWLASTFEEMAISRLECPSCGRSSSASALASTATSPVPMELSISSSCPRTIRWARFSPPLILPSWGPRPTTMLSKWVEADSAARK